jgi:hypothetical protein
VIIRITRGQIRAGAESVAFDVLREAAQGPTRPDGLEALFIGRQMRAAGPELVAITVWKDLDAIVAVMGPTWAEATWLPGLAEHISDATVEHLETVVANYEGMADLGLTSMDAVGDDGQVFGG